MGSSPTISAVLATYNGRAYLRECIESVLAQTYEDFEFIIIDDASTDGSDEIIAEYAAREPRRVRSIRLPQNSGQGEGFNRGVAEARGRLVAFIDSDDLWFPDKLARVAAEFGDDQTVALHQHNLRLVRDGRVTDERLKPTVTLGDVFTETRRTRVLPGFVATTGLTFSRRALRQVLPVPRAFRVCADGFLTRTAIVYGRVSGTDECYGAYRVHETNSTFANPAFDSHAYLRDLLFPHLNDFYASLGIDLAFSLAPDVPPKFSMRALHVPPGGCVLFTRSAPVGRMQEALAAFFADFPDARVDLLVQPGFAGSFADPRITPVPLPAGMLPPDRLPDETCQRFVQQDYVCCLVPYNDADGRHYGNVHAALQLSGLKCPIWGIGSRGTLISVA